MIDYEEKVEETVEEVKDYAGQFAKESKTKIEAAVDRVKEEAKKIEVDTWLKFAGLSFVAAALYYNAKVESEKEADVIVKVIMEEKEKK